MRPNGGARRGPATWSRQPSWTRPGYWSLGIAYRRSRRRSEALDPLRPALEIADRCGGLMVATRARDELRALGCDRAARTGAWALTGSERRVVDLVAAGHSKREIAQACSSRLPVNVHLNHAYHKLGIRSRIQLADALAHRPPIAPG